MPKDSQTIHKLTYKPDSQSTDEYIILVDQVEYKKWKAGDTSIPMALIVESFDIFHSGQGQQGKLGRASKQQLETIFNTSKEDEAVKFMLENGTLQTGDAISGGWTEMNKSRGGHTVDTRGSGGGHK